MGPLPASRDGHTHLLTVIDRSTRWSEVALLKATDAVHVLDAFMATWVARFGVPVQLTTDRGPQFTSAVWAAWCEEAGVKHVTTTAFHPQSNGMMERLHRQMKDALRARGGTAVWAEHLPWVMLAIRATPKDESGVLAGEAALGHMLVLPNQLASTSSPASTVAILAVIPTTRRSYAEVAAVPDLETADYVFVRQGGQVAPLADNYAGPNLVLRRTTKVFKLQVGDRKEVVTRDRLKPLWATGLWGWPLLPVRVVLQGLEE